MPGAYDYNSVLSRYGGQRRAGGQPRGYRGLPYEDWQQRQDYTQQARYEQEQRAAMNRAFQQQQQQQAIVQRQMLMNEVKQKQAQAQKEQAYIQQMMMEKWKQGQKYPLAEFQSGLSNQNSAEQQSRASQYAQILERVRTGEIGLRDAQRIMLELGALPQQEQIKRESELEKRRRLVPIEVGQKVQEQDILGPKRTQEEVSKKTALNKVFDPLTDPYHKGVNDVSKDVLNPDYPHSDPDIMNQKRQLLLQKLTEGALASNDPRIKSMIQDVKAISEGKPEDFDANLKKAMSNVLWGQPEKNTIDIETAFKRMGGRDAVYQRQNAPLEELIKQKTIENIPGPWGDNFRKMGPLPTPAPGSQLDQSGMPGQMGVPATRTSSAGFINPQGDFSADPAELATKAATGQSLLSQWLAQSDPNMMQQSSGLSPEDQWTQRRDEIAGRSQDRNNVFSAEGLPPVGDMAQAPQPQPDFSSLTATGQPPEKSDTYYQMLAYMQAEEEKKQREMDGRPPYDQWAEAPQDQFVPGYSSLEG